MAAKVEVNTRTANLLGPDGKARQAVDGYFSHPPYFVTFTTTPSAEGAKVMYIEAQRTVGDTAAREEYIKGLLRNLGTPDVRGVPAYRVAPYFFQSADGERERLEASEGQISLGWAEVEVSNGKVIYGAQSSGRGLVCDCYKIQRNHNPSMPFLCVIRTMDIGLWHKYLARND